MPRELVVSETTRDAGTIISRAIEITDRTNKKAIQYLIGNAIVDELPTTEIEWSIEVSRSLTGPWKTMVLSTVIGLNGLELYKPVSMLVSIDTLVGLFVRTRAIVNARFDYGIDVEIRG